MIYFLVSFVLDIILSNFISLGYQNVNLFFPEILVSSIPISYILIKNKKVFFTVTIFIGIIYDLLYSDVFLINLYYLILFGLFLYIFYNNRKVTVSNVFLISVFGLVLYDVFIFIILILINYSSFNINDFYYKMKNSLLINMSYIIISLFILKSRIFGHKKTSKKSLKRRTYHII